MAVRIAHRCNPQVAGGKFVVLFACISRAVLLFLYIMNCVNLKTLRLSLLLLLGDNKRMAVVLN